MGTRWTTERTHGRTFRGEKGAGPCAERTGVGVLFYSHTVALSFASRSNTASIHIPTSRVPRAQESLSAPGALTSQPGGCCS
eukprot:5725841-Prymnesium_polylepis.1